MKIRSRILARSRRAQAGQGMVEYALLLALIAVVVVAVLATLGDKNGPVGQTFDRVTDNDKGNLSRGKPSDYPVTPPSAVDVPPSLTTVPPKPPESSWFSSDDSTYVTVSYVPMFADPTFSLN